MTTLRSGNQKRRFSGIGSTVIPYLMSQAPFGCAALHLCREGPNRSVAALGLAHASFGSDTGTMHMAAPCGVPCLIVSAQPAGASVSHYPSPERHHT